jgi:hypothetical protein
MPDTADRGAAFDSKDAVGAFDQQPFQSDKVPRVHVDGPNGLRLRCLWGHNKAFSRLLEVGLVRCESDAVLERDGAKICELKKAFLDIKDHVDVSPAERN